MATRVLSFASFSLPPDAARYLLIISLADRDCLSCADDRVQREDAIRTATPSRLIIAVLRGLVSSRGERVRLPLISLECESKVGPPVSLMEKGGVRRLPLK